MELLMVEITVQGEDRDTILMSREDLDTLLEKVNNKRNITINSYLQEDAVFTAQEAYVTFIEWAVG
jgi:hypothetical protein